MKKFFSLLLILALTLTMFGQVALADECAEGGKHDWRQNGLVDCETGTYEYVCIKCFSFKQESTGTPKAHSKYTTYSDTVFGEFNHNVNVCTENYCVETRCRNCRYYSCSAPHAPMGHNFGDSWKPLADRPGYEIGTCARCGATWTREIEGYWEPAPEVESDALMTVTKTVKGIEEGKPLVEGRTYEFLIHVNSHADSDVYKVLVMDEMAAKKPNVVDGFEVYSPGETLDYTYYYTVTEEDFERGYIDTPAIVYYLKDPDSSESFSIESDFCAEVVRSNISTRMPHTETEGWLSAEIAVFPEDGSVYPASEVCNPEVLITNTSDQKLKDFTTVFYVSNEFGDNIEFETDHSSGTLNPGESFDTYPVDYRLTEHDLDSFYVSFYAVVTARIAETGEEVSVTSNTVTLYHAYSDTMNVSMTVEQSSPVKDVYYRGDSITYTVTLRNFTAYPVKNVVARSRQFTDSDNRITRDFNLGSLALHEKRTEKVTVQIDETMEAPETLDVTFFGIVDSAAFTGGGKEPEMTMFSYELAEGESSEIRVEGYDLLMRVEQTSIAKEKYNKGDIIAYSVTLYNRGEYDIEDAYVRQIQVNSYSRLYGSTGFGSIPAGGSKTEKVYLRVIPVDAAPQFFTMEFQACIDLPGETRIADSYTTPVYKVNTNSDYNFRADDQMGIVIEQTGAQKSIYNIGDIITYDITLINKGTVTLYNPIVMVVQAYGKNDIRVLSNDNCESLEPGKDKTFKVSFPISTEHEDDGTFNVICQSGYQRKNMSGGLETVTNNPDQFEYVYGEDLSDDIVSNWHVAMTVEQVTPKKDRYAENDIVGFKVTLVNDGLEPLSGVKTDFIQFNCEDRFLDSRSIGSMAPGETKEFLIDLSVKHYWNAYKFFTVNFHTMYKPGPTGNADTDRAYASIMEQIGGYFYTDEIVELYINPDLKTTEVNDDITGNYRLYISADKAFGDEPVAKGETKQYNITVANVGHYEICTDVFLTVNLSGTNIQILSVPLDAFAPGEVRTFPVYVTVDPAPDSPKEFNLEFRTTYMDGIPVEKRIGIFGCSNISTVTCKVDPNKKPDDYGSSAGALIADPEIIADIVQIGDVKEFYDEGDVLTFLCAVTAFNSEYFDEKKVEVKKSGSFNTQKKTISPTSFIYYYTVTGEDAADGYFTITWDFYGYRNGAKVYDKNLRALSFYCNRTGTERNIGIGNQALPGGLLDIDTDFPATTYRPHYTGPHDNLSRPNVGNRPHRPETQTGNELPDESNVVPAEDVFLTGSFGMSDDMWATDEYTWNFSIVNEGDTDYTGGYLVLINTASGDSSAQERLPGCAANSTVGGLTVQIVPTPDEVLSELVMREAYAVLTAADGSAVRTDSIFFTVTREPLEGLIHLDASAKLDQDDYRANDTISAVITLTNTSLAPIYDIDLDVSGAGRNDSDTLSQELDAFLSGCDCLEPGDSFSFTYDIVLTAGDEEAGCFYRGFRAQGYNEDHLQFALSNQADLTAPMKAGERGSAALRVMYSGKDSIIASEGTVIGLPLLINNNGSCDLNGFVFTDLDRNEIMQSSIGAKYQVYAGIPDGALIYTEVTAEDIESGCLLRNIGVTAEDADPESTLSVTTGFTVLVTLDTKTTYPELKFTARAVNLSDAAWQEDDEVLIELTITNNSAVYEIIPEKYVLTLDGTEVASGSGNILFPLSSCVSYCSDVLTAQDVESSHYEREILLTYDVYDEWYDSYTATVRGTVSADAPEAAGRRVTLSGSTWVDVGSALDGAFGYEWSPTVTNETGEKITFDFLFIHNGEEKVDTVPLALEAGESLDYCYGITPVLTDEEKETIRTDADSATTYYTLQVIAHGESGKTYYSNVITFTYTVYPSPYAYSIYTSVKQVNEDGSFVLELGNETPQFTGIDMKIDSLYMDSPSAEGAFETAELFGDRVFEPGEYDYVTITPNFTDEEYELGYFEREIEVRGSGYNEQTDGYDIWTSGYISVKGTLNGSAAADTGWDKDYPLAGTLSVSAVPVDYGMLLVTVTNNSSEKADQVTVVCGDDQGLFIGDTHLHAGDTESDDFILHFTDEERASERCTRDLYVYAYDSDYSDTEPAFSSNVVHLDFDIHDDFADSGLLKLTAGGQNMFGETVMTLTNMSERDIEDLTLVGTTNKEHVDEENSFEAYLNEYNSLYTGFGKNCDITFSYKPTFTAEELANGAYIRNLYVLGYVFPIFWTASNTVTLTGTCGDRKNDAAIGLYVDEYSGTEKEVGEDLVCTREVTIVNAGLYPIEGIRVITDSGSIFAAKAERLEPGEITVCDVEIVVEGCKPGFYTHKLIVTANAVGAPAGTVPMATASMWINLGE